MIIDNKSHGKVGVELQNAITNKSRLSFISGCISIWAFAELKKELSKVEQARFLFPDIELDKSINDSVLLFAASDRKFRNSLNLPKVARECASWFKSKADVKAAGFPIPQNLFHVTSEINNATAIHGSSSFTTEGLGITPSRSMHMNYCSNEISETNALLEWFDSIWNDSMEIRDVKNDLLAGLTRIFEDKSPKAIYFSILYNIFKDFIGEIEEENIIKTKTGIKETLVWNKLYKFQKDGVLGAIDKIERFNGCIIADSVGLGKTFEALAVIKYYELRNDRILVLCPKKLRENWTLYTINDKRNILAEDRFNYDVLNHTDLTRSRGMSGEINLATINWSNYDLVVIDESHNFRNNPARKEGITRYSRLMDELIRAGVKTKILMLSATPVNSRMNDLKNQVAFITEGIDDALYNNGIYSIEQTLKKAQTRFNQWLRLDEDERTTEKLLSSLNFDYFKLLDLLTIARSRKHIEKYYDITEIGDFPVREIPRNIKADIDLSGKFPPLREINRNIRRLNLGAYAPLKYVLEEKREEYSRKYDMTVQGGSVFRQVDREQNLIHLVRVNLLKRMESSINSFTQTLESLLENVRLIIGKIDSHEREEFEELNIEEIEADSEEYEPFVVGRKVKVLIQDVDCIRWNQDLQEDEELLIGLLRESRQIDADRDAKLAELKQLIEDKVQNPINPGNRKIIIFTAFADTAKYLYKNIAHWAKQELRIYSALVTGTGVNQTTMSGIHKDISSILSSFSPISKERIKIDDSLKDEIDILIATDCISEGQNLQDCDYLINYDIHWNPVRIIQRFGRIDRLGSLNGVIQLVNFWPNMELDEYINLEARVSGRMVLLDISATGEENVIEYTDAGKMNDLEYRRRQLERLQKEVVDIEDINGGISITDLTMNDFRMDLSGFLKENPEEMEHFPLGAFAVVSQDELIDCRLEPGVVFCLKNINGKVLHDSSYALEPYYLIYVADDGRIILSFSQAKKILDIVKKLSLGHSSPDETALDWFNQRTNNANDMAHYRALLSKAVAELTGKAEEFGMSTLFKPEASLLSDEFFGGINDFEVVSYLIIAGENTLSC